MRTEDSGTSSLNRSMGCDLPAGCTEFRCAFHDFALISPNNSAEHNLHRKSFRPANGHATHRAGGRSMLNLDVSFTDTRCLTASLIEHDIFARIHGLCD